jgi:two-component system OmpR family response regulator
MTEPSEEDLTAVLVADSDPVFSAMISRTLADYGLGVFEADSAKEADQIVAREPLVLALIDLRLPTEGGLEFCRRLRRSVRLPIIMMSDVKDDTDRIVSLELGADDFLTKPINPRELLARINAVRRRASMRPKSRPTDGQWRFAGFTLDPITRHLRGPLGAQLYLTSAEAQLLNELLLQAGKAVSRRELMQRVSLRSTADARSVDLVVSRLRRRLSQLGNDDLISTERGAGYRITRPVEPG